MPTDSEAAATPSEDAGIVNVNALMAQVRGRVRDKKARGEYTLDAVTLDAVESADAGFAQRIEELRSIAVQRVDLTPWPSKRPLAGPLLERGRLLLSRTLSRPLFGLAEQSSMFNAALIANIASLSREVAELRRQLADASEEISALRERAPGAPGEHGRP